jgi:hypothetical protein
MIYEKIYAKNLVYTLFCISDAVVCCELFGDDKISGLHTKKISLLFIFSLFYKGKGTFSLSLFYEYKDLIYLYFLNIKIFFIFIL